MAILRSTFTLLAFGAICLTAGGAQSPKKQNDIDRRVDALLARMTPEEKIGQLVQYPSEVMTGPHTHSEDVALLAQRGELGSVINLGSAEKTNRLQHIAVEQSRLHIPLIFGRDVIHGERTIFPVPLGLAATFDPELVTRLSRLAAEEASHDGIRWVFSPMVDIARDARWGRIVESAGEDPFLGSRMARAYVEGYQGSSLNAPDAVAACVKHFAAYGAPIAGRDYSTVDLSDTQLRQVYLQPYHAAVDAGAATVMSAFSTLNGIPPTANRWLLTDVLRGEWDFRGVVVSDWNAIGELVQHGVATNPADAAAEALQAGTDVDMASGAYAKELLALKQQNRVSQEDIDNAVRRVLRLKFELGLFDHPYAEAPSDIHPTEAKRVLARHAAEESFVLLKNDLAPIQEYSKTGDAGELYAHPAQPLLPLDPAKHQSIALIGPLADAPFQMLGSWSAAGDPADVRTLGAALASRLGSRLLYARGTDIRSTSQAGFPEALDAARKADIVVLTLGEDAHEMTGEATSRSHLDLPGNQEQLLEAVSSIGKPVILIVFSGRPLILSWAAHHVPAILAAWFPGIEAGPALAETLFGEAVPSGHLPVEFPYAVGQEPLFLAQLPTGRPVYETDLSHAPTNGGERSHSRYIDEYNEPVFPFGWGLSYSSFQYGPITAKPDANGASVQISVEVRNSGKYDADDVAQLYFRRRVAAVAQPLCELKGFQRVHLKAGESRQITFSLSQNDIAFYRGNQKITSADGDFDLWIGDASDATDHAVLSSRSGKIGL